MQKECVECRSDAATAVQDNTFVRRCADPRKFVGHSFSISEDLAVPDLKVCCGDINATGNAARSTISINLPTMQFGRKCIERANFVVTDSGLHLIFADKKFGSRLACELCGGECDGICRDGALLDCPLIPSAIKNSSIVKPNGSKHPPDPRGPLHILARVEDYPSVISDAMTGKHRS